MEEVKHYEMSMCTIDEPARLEGHMTNIEKKKRKYACEKRNELKDRAESIDILALRGPRQRSSSPFGGLDDDDDDETSDSIAKLAAFRQIVTDEKVSPVSRGQEIFGKDGVVKSKIHVVTPPKIFRSTRKLSPLIQEKEDHVINLVFRLHQLQNKKVFISASF